MIKKICSISLVSVLLWNLVSCAGGTNSSSGQKSEAPSFPPALIGEWKQTNSNSDDSWQSATIGEDAIEVYWVTDNGDTKSLYWAGTFKAPETADESYSWDSENDHEKTDYAMLASGDDIKTFTYKDGELSYSVSALGTTTTVKLEKEG